jgi:hypothetical protein
VDGEELLPGGTLTTATRCGDTVRRPTGFWSPSVHALLRHLDEAGFSGAPRFLGIDAQGREMLTYVHGDVTIDGPPPGMHSEEALTAASGPPEWDVAYALWRFVPFYDDAACARLGWPVTPRGPRIARFLDAYGLDRRDDLFDVVLRRMEVTRTTIETWADGGDPAYIRLRREGRLTEITENIRYVEQSWQF